MSVESFIETSRVLTGLDDLPAFLGPGYQARVEQLHGAGALERLANVSPAALLATLDTDDDLRAVAESIALLWYTSATVDLNETFTFGSPREYFASRLWHVIGAHPPGLSGGYMGHWRYPPE